MVVGGAGGYRDARGTQPPAILKIGNRFGMIKFGSRVDIILPPAAKIAVQPGQRTRAGETILARY